MGKDKKASAPVEEGADGGNYEAKVKFCSKVSAAARPSGFLHEPSFPGLLERLHSHHWPGKWDAHSSLSMNVTK